MDAAEGKNGGKTRAGNIARVEALDALLMLPETFLREYEGLFHRALDSGEDGRGERVEREVALGRAAGKKLPTRTATSRGVEGGGMRAARKGKGGGPGRGWGIRDTEALREKQWVDRQLRKLARQISSGVGRRADQGRCPGSGCGKWVEAEWKYCPGCGAHLTETGAELTERGGAE